jgi:hypothetical protein
MIRGYDAWKTETPEDEEDRHQGRGRHGWRDMRDADRCWHCRQEWKADPADEMLCWHCGADAQDAPPERDPDDARDERMDREMERYD